MFSKRVGWASICSTRLFDLRKGFFKRQFSDFFTSECINVHLFLSLFFIFNAFLNAPFCAKKLQKIDKKKGRGKSVFKLPFF